MENARNSDLLADKCVLLVEDQYLLAEEMARILKSLGAEVMGPASSAKRATEYLLSRLPDLALLDINLGNSDVFALARDLKRRGVPLVFATGYGMGALPEDLAEAKYIQKPVSIETLVKCVRDSLPPNSEP